MSVEEPLNIELDEPIGDGGDLEVEKKDPDAESDFGFLEEDDNRKAAGEPCEVFKLDTKAAKFGACKFCGFTKAEHGGPKANKAAELLTKLRAKNSTVSEDMGDMKLGDGGPCTVFKLDTKASEFGVCVYCGFKRADHEAKGVNKAQEALMNLRKSNVDQYKDVMMPDGGKRKSEGPCPTYKVDVSAAEFGACLYCGFKKEDHIEKAENAAAVLLKNLKQKNKEKEEAEERARQAELDRVKAEEEEQKRKELEAMQPQDPVDDLDREEQKAEDDTGKGKKAKKTKKKKKRCVIS